MDSNYIKTCIEKGLKKIIVFTIPKCWREEAQLQRKAQDLS